MINKKGFPKRKFEKKNQQSSNLPMVNSPIFLTHNHFYFKSLYLNSYIKLRATCIL